MIRHYKIRYNNKDEYITLHNYFGLTNKEQIYNYCISKNYDLSKVILLETLKKVNKPLLQWLKER